MAFGGVYEEVDCLVGSYHAPCFGDLGPELGGLGGTVGLVGVEPAGVDGCEKVEAEIGLALGGEVEGFDDGGSQTLSQKGRYACADASGVDDDSAAAPNVFEDVDKTRESLGVGFTRPPEVFDHSDRREFRTEAVVVVTEFTDGDDGGVAKRLGGQKPVIGRLRRFTGKVNAGYVDAPWIGGA